MATILAKVLRIIYYLLYNPFAWTYDWVAALVSCGNWKSWVLSTLPYLPGPKVLELGHGTGHLQAALAQKGIYSVGLDASRSMGRMAKSTLKRSNLNMRLVSGYAQFISFQSNTFSQVVATFPSDYIFDLNTLAEIRRVLQPDGKLIVLLGAWNTQSNFCSRVSGWLLRKPGEFVIETILPYLEPFKKSGFNATPQVFEQGKSRLLFIFAEPSFLES